MYEKTIRALTILGALWFVACGPPGGEAEIEVSHSDDDAGSSMQGTTTPGGTDTVFIDTVRERTIVQREVDTVIVNNPSPGTPSPARMISPEERTAIDEWLQAQADVLNEYGDPEGTVYAGGTPLFNESTGQRVDKYEYIAGKHPDRPWLLASNRRR